MTWNHLKLWALWLTLISLITISGSARADQEAVRERTKEPSDKQAQSAPKTKDKAKAKSSALTVAILDFAARQRRYPDLGKRIGDVLTAVLSDEPGFRLIERTAVSRMLQEQELLPGTGLVNTNELVKVGKLIGAEIVVTGLAYRSGAKSYISTKSIGTKTGFGIGMHVEGNGDTEWDALVLQLADRLGEHLRRIGPRLVARNDAVGPLPALKQKLVTRKLPKVAVVIFERHEPQIIRPQPIDLAVETEIKLLLVKCGFHIQDVRQHDLADWAQAISHDHIGSWPRSLENVDVVITGKAFSEFDTRIGNFVSCAARAEAILVRRKDGRIIHTYRATTRNVDLSENIAGKKALQKAGRVLGIRIIEDFVRTVPKENAKSKGL